MTKKSKIELNRATDFTDMDAELDDALAKLESTSSRVDEILATESGTTPRAAGQTSADEEADADESDESEEE